MSLFLTALLGLATAVAVQAAQPPAAPRWAHEAVGRPADPAVRFGTLKNGLRYAVMRNETPKDGVAMRMRIGAGSLHERDDEQGLAHLLEHMAFRGSRNVADGEVVRMLERQGLRFGPDTNAFTAHEQTVYMFNFPKADRSALDTGLTLFREIGERLTIDAAALEIEKGVVLSEERAGDVPPARAGRADLNQALAGTRAAQRWPIGLVEKIRAATPERLRRFYEANYRPDNATIIVVGAIDVAAVVQEIETRFGDWRSTATGDRIDLGQPVPGRAATEFVAPGVPDRLSVSWIGRADLRPDTLELERERLLNGLAMAVLNTRLAQRALQPGSPFVGAGAGHQGSVFGVAEVTQLNVVAPPQNWKPALDAAVEEFRRLADEGATAEDLQRVVTMVRTQMQSAVAQASTRPSAALADGLVQSVNGDAVFTHPAQGVASIEPILAAVTPKDVTAALRELLKRPRQTVFRSAQADPVTPAVLEQQLTAAMTRPLATRVAQAAAVWPYSAFGEPSAVVSRTADEALGATLVRFANGTRLIVKPTSFQKDSIDIRVSVGHGRWSATPEQARMLWALQLFTVGGTGKMSLAEILQWAQGQGKVLQIALRADAEAFIFSAGTRPVDLRTQMELLAAYARDPGFRPEMADRVVGIAPMLAGQLKTQPGSPFGREVQRMLTGGDVRLIDAPMPEDLVAPKPELLKALLQPALGGAADVSIVGDVTVDQAIAVTQATFGAGSVAPRTPRPDIAVTPTPPRAETITVTHGGRADQALYGRYWLLPDHFADPKLAAVAQVTAAVLQSRLVDTVREQLGITYSPQVGADASVIVRGRGDFSAALETPREKFATFDAVLMRELETLAKEGLSADALLRARQPMIESRTKSRETNSYWAENLVDLLGEPRIRDRLASPESSTLAVTAEDVQRFVRERLLGRPSQAFASVAAAP